MPFTLSGMVSFIAWEAFGATVMAVPNAESSITLNGSLYSSLKSSLLIAFSSALIAAATSDWDFTAAARSLAFFKTVLEASDK